MTFRLTDDFAKIVCRSLETAYKMLEDRAVDTSQSCLSLEQITAVAMVKTAKEIIFDCIGNDQVVVKKIKKHKAIKSV